MPAFAEVLKWPRCHDGRRGTSFPLSSAVTEAVRSPISASVRVGDLTEHTGDPREKLRDVRVPTQEPSALRVTGRRHAGNGPSDQERAA